MDEGFVIIPKHHATIDVLARNAEIRRRMTPISRAALIDAALDEAFHRYGYSAASPAQCILADVSSEYGIAADLLTGEDRHYPVVRARNDLFSRLRKRHWSLPRIGAFCGGRDHTTVLHGLRQHAARVGAAQ